MLLYSFCLQYVQYKEVVCCFHTCFDEDFMCAIVVSGVCIESDAKDVSLYICLFTVINSDWCIFNANINRWENSINKKNNQFMILWFVWKMQIKPEEELGHLRWFLINFFSAYVYHLRLFICRKLDLWEWKIEPNETVLKIVLLSILRNFISENKTKRINKVTNWRIKKKKLTKGKLCANCELIKKTKCLKISKLYQTFDDHLRTVSHEYLPNRFNDWLITQQLN